jgi:transposase
MFNLCHKLKGKAWENGNWQEVGALKPYKIQSFSRKLDEYPYRFVVVYSDKLNEQKGRTLQRNLEKEKTQLEKSIRKFETTIYHCQSDAEKAVSEFKKRHLSHYFHYELTLHSEEQTEKRAKRGRPKKEDTQKAFTVYRPQLHYLRRGRGAVAEKKRKMSIFILITDLLDRTDRTDAENLQTYKGQEAAETRFR